MCLHSVADPELFIPDPDHVLQSFSDKKTVVQNLAFLMFESGIVAQKGDKVVKKGKISSLIYAKSKNIK
jgi:hypothetical protein